MRNRLLILGLALCGVLSGYAQDTRQVYLVKGKKIIATYPRTDVDYITFAKPSGTTQTDYRITADDGSDYIIVGCPKTAEAGSDVIFGILVSNEARRPGTVQSGGVDCDYIYDDGTTWYYTFVMPQEDVTVTVATEADMHVITPVQGAHTTLVMLNSSDDWDKEPAEQVFDNVVGQPVKFLWSTDPGYTGSLTVTTKSGQAVAYEYVEDDETFGKCWLFTMPDEPVTIETRAEEKTEYAGRPFVGAYKGYPITVGENGVWRGTDPSVSLTLSGNTAFDFSTTGDGALTVTGCYAYDETKHTFAYLPEYSTDMYGKKTYGVSGNWFEGGDVFAYTNDLNDDKPDNVKYYFLSTSDFDLVAAASDNYGSRFLLELQNGSEKRWYYYSKLDNTVQPVDLRTMQASSIADNCSAIVYDAEGTPLFRYSRASADAQPVFTLRGSEAGTYTLQGGTAADAQLTLDGFGTATYGTVTGSYVLDKGVVTFTAASGAKTTFVIDTTAKTYTTSASSTWDGAETFTAMTTGYYDGNASSMGMLALQLNHNYAGTEAEGKVKVSATLTDEYYQTKEIIASTASYTYDASAGTITVTGVLVGTADGRSTERINIVFDVSADKTTLTCNEDKKLRATSGGDTRYIDLHSLQLKAR